MNNQTYIKRNKGLFLTDDNRTLEQKIESEFDNIVKKVNQAFNSLEPKTAQTSTYKDLGGGVINIYGVGTYNILNTSSDSENIIYGAENRTIIKPITYANPSLILTTFESGDWLKLITIVTKKPDTGVTDFKLNDGANDLAVLEDVNFSEISVAMPPKAMCVDYTENKSLEMYLEGATIFEGVIIIDILKRILAT